MVREMPQDIWDGTAHTCIHATVLFADIQNSVLLSSALSLADYDRLIDEFQAVMLSLTTELRTQGVPLAESSIAGDQLALFFYDPQEVERNWALDGPQPLPDTERQQLIAASRAVNIKLVYSALKAAIQFKNIWLAQRFNIERVLNHHAPFEAGIGISYGRVFLRNRVDGQRRIEGYAVSLGKRVESASRLGRFSGIMLNQDACETLRSAVIAHTQLRQRVFFERHEHTMDMLKGVISTQPVYELKFCHRIRVPLPADAVAQHAAIFAVDPTRIWSYYQLVEYYAYDQGDWDMAYQLASRAHVMYPNDEKVKLDLANYHLERNELQMSLMYCKQALAINAEFDLAYEKLAVIANKLHDMASCMDYLRQAVSLSPGSAVNHLNLGMVLVDQHLYAEALEHFQQALAIYPTYCSDPLVLRNLRQAAEHWPLPPSLEPLLAAAPDPAAADLGPEDASAGN